MKERAFKAAVLEQKKLRRRLKARRGNVIFIESTPDGMKDWLIARAEKNGRAMVREVVAILEEKRAAEPGTNRA